MEKHRQLLFDESMVGELVERLKYVFIHTLSLRLQQVY